jgi:hypothetical protein
LRPLSSRIALLRKQRERELERKSNDLHKAAVDDIRKPQSKDDDPISRLPQQSRFEYSSQDDPDWTNDCRPRKKLKRTYSGRRNPQKHSLAAEIPSLALQRVGDNDSMPKDSGRGTKTFMDRDSTTEESSSSRAPAKSDLTRESFRRLAKTLSPTEWMLDEGLYTGLDALLKATARSKPGLGTGTRSLLATCLRQVPQVIAEEHRWIEEEESEDEDAYTKITTSVYEDLESLGQGNNGWKPLREVVRAHGIALLGDAIKQKYVKPAITRCLVILCLQASAYEEAESLVESMLCAREPISRPAKASENLFQRCLAMRTLWDIARIHNRWKFLYRQLTKDLETRFLPVEWMACQDVHEFWIGVFRSLSLQNGASAEAMALLKTAVWMSHNNGFSSSADIVHMLRLLSQGKATRKQLDNSVRMLYSSSKSKTNAELEMGKIDARLSQAVTGWLSSLIQTSIELSPKHDKDSFDLVQDTFSTLASDCQILNLLASLCTRPVKLTTQDARFCLPLLANCLYTLKYKKDPMLERSFSTMIKGIAMVESKGGGLDELVQLIDDVGSRSDHSPNGYATAFDYIADIIRFFLDLLNIVDYSAAHPNIKQIIIEAAFMFAEQQPKREHLDWALEVEDEVQGYVVDNQLQPRTPARRPKKPVPVFKWDESMSEWVAKTPAPSCFIVSPTLEQGQDVPSFSSSDDESDIGSTGGSLHGEDGPSTRFSSISRYSESNGARSEGETTSHSRGAKKRKLAVDPEKGFSEDYEDDLISPYVKASNRLVFKDIANSANNVLSITEAKAVSHIQPVASWRLGQVRGGLKRKSAGWDGGDDISEDELGL